MLFSDYPNYVAVHSDRALLAWMSELLHSHRNAILRDSVVDKGQGQTAFEYCVMLTGLMSSTLAKPLK